MKKYTKKELRFALFIAVRELQKNHLRTGTATGTFEDIYKKIMKQAVKDVKNYDKAVMALK